ncbi:dephospho-coA kinase, putative [Leishmania tarentolae]|uniref:Dephospho-coA kinase, putative n=1 Tax=Leishmania tarentolae TaxID=5689 RepID=A0A640KGN5_LEITA|nr:dephospho-coA kinase, putative [Leishmania tarentolae]
MILIGLTGGIACGKSSVSRILREEFHIEVIDADLVVRELQAPNSACTRRIAARWPLCVHPETGELNRAALGKIVFSDAQARRELGKIMNPAIFKAILKRIAAAWWRDLWRSGAGTSPSIVVLDAPMLFETKTFTYFISAAVVVSCSEQRQIERLRNRDGFSKEEALQRIGSQMSMEAKRRLGDYIIENDYADDLDALRGALCACVAWMSHQSNKRLTYIFGTVTVSMVGVATTVGYAGYRLLLA